MIKEIENTGYKVADDNSHEGKKNIFSIFQLAALTAIIIAFWLLLNKTGIFNQLPEINNSMSYGLLFVIGY